MQAVVVCALNAEFTGVVRFSYGGLVSESESETTELCRNAVWLGWLPWLFGPKASSRAASCKLSTIQHQHDVCVRNKTSCFVRFFIAGLCWDLLSLRAIPPRQREQPRVVRNPFPCVYNVPICFSCPPYPPVRVNGCPLEQRPEASRRREQRPKVFRRRKYHWVLPPA